MRKMYIGILLTLLLGISFALPDYRVGIDSLFNGTGVMTVGIRTFNQGTNANSTSFTNDTYDSGQGVMHQVPPLAQSQSYSYYHNVSCPPGQWLYLSAQADVWNVINESNEANNVVYYSTQCTAAQQLPDLVANASGLSGNKIVGQAFPVAVSTYNIGNAVAGVSITRVTFGSGQNLNVPSLAAGGMNTQTASVVCPFVGSIPFSSTADYYNIVTESNEANNGWSYNVNCVANQTNQTPDLIVSTLNVPATMVVNRVYSGSVTTRNIGQGSSIPSTTNVRLGSIYVTNAQVPALAPGATSTGNFNIQCTTPGRKQMIATADSTSTNTESNENNNMLVRYVNCVTVANETNTTQITSTKPPKNPVMAILNALGISLSDELLNAICAGR